MRCSHAYVSFSLLATLAFAASATAAEPTPQEVAATQSIQKLGGTVFGISPKANDKDVDFSIGGTDLTDDALVHLKHIRNITILRLRGTKITDAGLVHLKGLTDLKRLHLEKTAISDAGLAHLAGLKNLEYLNLYGTNVGDAGMAHLTNLKKLQTLFLWQTEVTDDGLELLYEALPQLSIIRGANLNLAANLRRPIVVTTLRLPLAGEPLKISGIGYEDGNPGTKAKAKIYFRAKGQNEFASADLSKTSDGKLEAIIPASVTNKPLEFYLEIRELGSTGSTYPPAGAKGPKQITPDATPPQLAAEPQASDIASFGATVSWSAATDDNGVATYRIYRSGEPSKVVSDDNLLKEVAPDQLKFRDEKPPAGETVWYAITAVDVAGRVSEPRLLKVDVPKDTPPTNDFKLTAIAGSNAVVINWTGTPESDVTALLIFRATGETGDLSEIAKLDDVAATRWIDKTVNSDKKYRYAIKLRDRGGNVSEPSNISVSNAGLYLRRINCGGPEVASPDGGTWEADSGAITGTGRYEAKTDVEGAESDLQGIYRTERWANRGLAYRLAVKPGRYLVVLHFAETNKIFSAAGKRVFNVSINGEERHAKVDIFAKAGFNKAWKLPTEVEVKEKEILLELRRVKSGPALKGIEVRLLE